MGVYNIIKFSPPLKCPECGYLENEWQSKNLAYSSYGLANVMRQITLNSRMDGEVHTYCDQCKKYISFEIKKGKLIRINPD